MHLLREIKYLIWKDLLTEWRQNYAISGVLLYSLSTIFVIYLSFQQVDPVVWNTVFWIIMLFTSLNAVAKSFIQENQRRWLYYNNLVSPQAVILSKMLYNVGLMSVLAFVSLGIYSLIVGYPVQRTGLFMINLLLGVIGLSLTFTLVSALVARARNQATLMAILSFPVVIPLLLLLIKVSNSSMDTIIGQSFEKELLILGLMDVIILVLAYILFPYLWRD